LVAIAVLPIETGASLTEIQGECQTSVGWNTRISPQDRYLLAPKLLEALMKFRFVALAAALLMVAPQLAMAQFMDINTIISGIGGTKFLRDAERADSAAGLHVVRLSSLAGAEQSAARLDAAIELKERDIRFLQSNLVINPFAMRAIRNSNVSLEQIVSLTVSRDGGGALYANDL
jgi:hypothetical protein